MPNDNVKIPEYSVLVEATYKALKELGGSGKNKEINDKAAEILELDDDICTVPHTDRSISEINYRLAWARTLLKNAGAIENSARSVWVITTAYSDIETVDGEIIAEKCKNFNPLNPSDFQSEEAQTEEAGVEVPEEIQMEEAGVEVPDEARPWRKKLHNVLLEMDPYAFERLTQRLLRECGFDDVCVTKKSGDGGIDGFGKLRINDILSFNIAFQCKRYQGTVGAPEIRDFRGSWTAVIEKGIFITTGTFSKKAVEEASNSGKKHIDLIDGEAFITKIAELGLGVTEVKDYEIDEDFFKNI